MELLFQVLLVALAAAWCCGDPATTTVEPTNTTNTNNTTNTTTDTTTEASKGKRTIDQQLGYGTNDLQSRLQAAQPQQQAARGYYPGLRELLLRPQQDGRQLFAPLFGEAQAQAPLYPGYSPLQAFSSPLLGAQLPRLVPVIILRLHPTPAGPQIAQAFPALLHAPEPARPRVSLQALQSLLLQQQYRPEEPRYRPEEQQQYQQYQQYRPEAPEELVQVAPGPLKPVFGRKKPAAGKSGVPEPSYHPRPFKDQQ
ncbi:uncharacterized protein LOC134530657 [Bacillus rossius redtenbacheri]|uniref:uncharacterized protein LOC134530657 n=1 Tax=Bacillus rossius redtenbacheri TaxID=93214 RepID=UPI002FDE6A8B